MRDGTEDGDHGLSESLSAWQRSGDHATFDALWAIASRLVTDTVRHAFRRAACQDGTAVDEAVALVMHHLRRLPSKEVKQFEETGSARAYLVWLGDKRAADVLRMRRREARRQRMVAAAAGLQNRPTAETDCDEEVAAALRSAIACLDDRSRLVLESHLRGEPQAKTAKVLGVAKGTVTRIRQRAIAELRRLLGGEGDGPRRGK